MGGMFYGMYPWSRKAGCNCDSGGGGTGEGVTEEEVKRIVDGMLLDYPTTKELENALRQYAKTKDIEQAIKDCVTDTTLAEILRKYVLTADMTTAIDTHAQKIASFYLGHVRADRKTAEMTEPVGIDADGRLWVKPSEGGSGNPFPSGRVVYLNPTTYQNSANLQRIVDSLYQLGGGTIIFDAGTYMMDEAVYLHGCAVNIEGAGIKNTVFKATADISASEVRRSVWNPSIGHNEFVTELHECMFIFTKTSTFNSIRKCTIDGSRWSEGNYYKAVLHEGEGATFGIFFDGVDSAEIAEEGFQLKQYANESDRRTTNIQPCKLAHLEDLFVMGCDCGLYIDTYNFGVHVNDCIFSYNATGMCTTGSDNTYSNLEIAYNAIYGALILDGNSRLSNFKVYWNNTAGIDVPDSYVDTSGTLRYPWLLFGGKVWTSVYALQLQNRLMVNNVEIQDNLGKPLHITGNNNIITGLMIDCNGYKEGGMNNPASNWCHGIFIDGGSEGNNIHMTIGNYLNIPNLYKSPIDLHPNSKNNKVVICQTDNACVNKNPTVSGQTATETAIKVL